jgi:NAD(P)-dependent dehydrogenase (short-subunit alcohol dehydrogenase family)/acyl carrier protein
LLHEVLTLVHRGELSPLPFRQSATRVVVGIEQREPACLITGGLGELGVVVADLLIERGARHLLLVGRSPVPPHRHATLQRWRNLGVDVDYRQVDVTDETALRALLDRPIRGVVHAAGIGTHTPIAELSAAEIGDVLRPKVQGAAALHRVLAGRPLDFFVLFSSAAAVLPSPLLGAYAAANSWLDALAVHRCALGLPTLSIGWGFWEAGMAVHLNGPGRLRVPSGLSSFTPAQGAAVLGRLLDRGVTGHVVVTPADWPSYVGPYSDRATRGLLAELASAPTPEVFVPRARTAPITERVQPAEDRATLPGPSDGGDRISELVAAVLRLSPENVDRRRPLNRLGMDSLMATEIRTRIKREYGTDIPILTLLKGASIDDVAATLSPLERV